MKTLARPLDRTEITRRIQSLRDDSVRRWGRMSAAQMVCHLADGYRMMIGSLPTKPARSPLPRPLMRAIALYAPMQWPTGILTTPELDPDLSGTRPCDFDADIADLLTLLAGIATDPHPPFADRHPVFGTMSEFAWLRWAYLHADHHLRQFGV